MSSGGQKPASGPGDGLPPRRVQLSRAKGWRMPPNTVKVDRSTKRGNPFVVGVDGTRLQCVTMFAILADGFLDLGGRIPVEEQLETYRLLRRAAKDLKGKNIACWCPLDQPCHGDVWLWQANGDPPHPLTGVSVDLPRVRLGMDVRQFEKSKRAADRRRREEAAAAAEEEG